MRASDDLNDGKVSANGTDVKYVNGSGTLAGAAHQEAFNQVTKTDSVMVSESLRRDFDKPLLDAAFPGWPVGGGVPADAGGDSGSRQWQCAVGIAGRTGEKCVS